MHLLTVSHAQFAENNLVHKADQIRNGHVEEFMCSRSASKAWWSGDDERMVTGQKFVLVAQDTWHYHQATVTQGRRLAEAFFREAWHSAPHQCCVHRPIADQLRSSQTRILTTPVTIFYRVRGCRNHDFLLTNSDGFGLQVTVLPEKLIAVIGASKGHSGIVIANTASSKIFLLTLCLGVVCVSKKDAGTKIPFELAVALASVAGCSQGGGRGWYYWWDMCHLSC